MNKYYSQVQKQLVLCWNPQENTSILLRDIFLFALQDFGLVNQSTCQRLASIGQQPGSGKWLENMKPVELIPSKWNQPASYLQAQVNQLTHQRVNPPQYKRRARRDYIYNRLFHYKLPQVSQIKSSLPPPSKNSSSSDNWLLDFTTIAKNCQTMLWNQTQTRFQLSHRWVSVQELQKVWPLHEEVF